MYRRYTQMQGDSLPVTQVKRNRVKNIIILVLAAALIAGAVFVIPMMRREGEEKPLYIQRMQAECSEAAQLVTTLSRYAGADSAEILAQVRSHLYAIRTLNNMYIIQHREALVSEEKMDNLVKKIDDYLYDISKGGQNTSVQQTELNIQMEQLQNELNEL